MFIKFEDGRDLAPVQWRYTRQLIAELRPGWSMEYIDSLLNHEVSDIFAIQSARIKAKAESQGIPS